MSQADLIFIEMCKDILENGFSDEGFEVRPRWPDGTPAHTIKKSCVVNRVRSFQLSFHPDLKTHKPEECCRRASLDLAEKSNNIKDLNSHIWDAWADENGSIGKAYGYQLGIRHRYKEGEFDQVDRVLFDLKRNPYSRRIITNMYNHADLIDMNLYPCAYSVTFNVSGRKLNAILNQRSQDVLVANNWNVVQYAVLVHMFAQVSGLEVGELVHVIADAHIYDRHIPLVKELISREPHPAPEFIMNSDIKDFYAFEVSDFRLENYITGPQIRNIPVAV